MSTDLELNPALGNQTFFIKYVDMVLSKSNETQNLKIRVKIKKKSICDGKAPHGEVVGSKSLYIQDLRIHGSRIGQIRFSLSSFNFRPCPDFHQKMLKKCKN